MPRTGQVISLTIAILSSCALTLTVSADEIDWNSVLQAAKNQASSPYRNRATRKSWLTKQDARALHAFARRLSTLPPGSKIELQRGINDDPFLTVAINKKASVGLAQTSERVITAIHPALKNGTKPRTLQVKAGTCAVKLKIDENTYHFKRNLLRASHSCDRVPAPLRPMASELSNAKRKTNLTFTINEKNGNARLESKTVQGTTLLGNFGIPYGFVSPILPKRGGEGRIHISRTNNEVVVRLTRQQATAEMKIPISAPTGSNQAHRVSLKYGQQRHRR